MSLKQTTFSSIIFILIDRFVLALIQFFVTLFLARLLEPSDFGLIASFVIFISISKLVIDSGLSQAFIREDNITPADYFTAFTINVLISILIYFIFFYQPLL